MDLLYAYIPVVLIANNYDIYVKHATYNIGYHVRIHLSVGFCSKWSLQNKAHNKGVLIITLCFYA